MNGRLVEQLVEIVEFRFQAPAFREGQMMDPRPQGANFGISFAGLGLKRRARYLQPRV